MRDRIKVSTTGLQLKSTSCSDQSRPYPSGCTLFFPFRGPMIGANHIEPEAPDPGSVRTVGFEVNWVVQLAINSFNDLEERVEEAANRLRESSLLVTPGQGEQMDAIV